MDAGAVVRAIGGLTLVGRMLGGEGAGAFEVRTDDGTRAVLKFAHMVLRQVDWSIRFHGEPEVQWFLDIGTALLDAVDPG